MMRKRSRQRRLSTPSSWISSMTLKLVAIAEATAVSLRGSFSAARRSTATETDDVGTTAIWTRPWPSRTRANCSIRWKTELTTDSNNCPFVGRCRYCPRAFAPRRRLHWGRWRPLMKTTAFPLRSAATTAKTKMTSLSPIPKTKTTAGSTLSSTANSSAVSSPFRLT